MFVRGLVIGREWLSAGPVPCDWSHPGDHVKLQVARQRQRQLPASSGANQKRIPRTLTRPSAQTQPRQAFPPCLLRNPDNSLSGLALQQLLARTSA